MGLNKYRLGDLIEYCDIRNSEYHFSELHVRGISNTKELMPTKADLLNRTLDDFKVVFPNEFVFNRRTTRMGEKFAITFNNTSTPVIVTNDYVVFKVIKKDILSNEYLFMLFNRPEFDRYVRFNSWGSATEMFVWENMCDVVITLPSITKQRKYVNVYLALQNNLAAYQSKVEELKTVCDGYIDKIKKVASKTKLVELLEPIDKRNSDLAYSGVQGININKTFFPTVANVDENNTHNYKIVEQNQFAFSGMQTGRDKCIRIALHEESYPIIISPAYTVFKVKNESVLSHYIMLWFARQEVDRYGWFASDGSIRSNLDLERFYDMAIPLPDISIQQKIVNIHKCYIERKRIAAQLKERLNNLCPILINGSLRTDN